MAGISRRCKRRPNSGVGGCTNGGAGSPPAPYPSPVGVIKTSASNPYAPPPRVPPTKVKAAGNKVVLSFNQPVVAATTGITVKVTKGTG
jgi:hypothetical protein